METILNQIRRNEKLHNFLRKFYGNTLGLWWLKTLYLRHVGLWNGKKRIRLLNEDISNKLVSQKIKSGKPFALARYGSTEFRSLFEDNLKNLCFYSGFFPNKPSLLNDFRKEYLESSKTLDILAVWNYKNHFLNKIRLLKNLKEASDFVPISVSKYDSEWIKSLAGKRVLVVHPFKKSIDLQYSKRKQLGILPKLKSLEVIKAVQTLAETPDPRFKDWFEALEYLKREIDKKKFDIAILGCGAYGLPLASYIKSRGKQSLHLGGGVQLLFGIKGKRWGNWEGIKNNPLWISPLKEDTIPLGRKIEGGCYW